MMSVSFPDHSAFSGSQRHCHLLLLLYLPDPTVTVDSLSQLNRVERLTVRQDIAKVAADIRHCHRLALIRNADGHYRIDGAELDQRLCLLHWLRRSLRLVPDFVSHHFAPALKRQLTARRTEKALYDERNLQALVQHCAHALSREFSCRDGTLVQLFIQHALCRRTRIEFSDIQQAWLASRTEYQVAQKIVHLWQKRDKIAPDASEIGLCTLLFSQIHTPLADHVSNEYERRLLQAVRQLTERFQRIAAVRFSDEKGLCSQLYTHIAQALERSLFGVGVDASLTQDIVRRYPRLMRTAGEAVADFEQFHRLNFSQEELGLIAIIFGAWLMQEDALQEKQVLLLTRDDPQLEQDLVQQLRELTLLPLNITFLDVEEYQRHGAPKGIALVITPYATSLPLYSPPLIHTGLTLQVRQQHRIRVLLGA